MLWGGVLLGGRGCIIEGWWLWGKVVGVEIVVGVLWGKGCSGVDGGAFYLKVFMLQT